MAGPAAQTLMAAIDGRAPEHPVVAPLFAALACELEEREPQAFLADAGARARALAGLARALRVSLLVVDSGSGWDAEAMGFTVAGDGVRGRDGGDDGDGGGPPLVVRLPPGAGAAFDPAGGGAPVIADLLARVGALVAPETSLGVTVCGPAMLAASGGGTLTLEAAVTQVLAAARMAATSGASVIVVREDGAVGPGDPAAYARLSRPLWASLRFFRAAGVLQVSGGSAAVAWGEVLAAPGPFLPCWPAPEPAPARSGGEAVAGGLGGLDGRPAAAGRPYGLAVAPGGEIAARGARGRCALVTHDGDLLGRVAIRDVAGAVAALAAGAS